MKENTQISICAPTSVYTYVCNVCVQVQYLLTYRLHAVIHLQVVVFHELGPVVFRGHVYHPC